MGRARTSCSTVRRVAAAFLVWGRVTSALAASPVILVDPMTPENRAAAEAAVRAYPRLRELSGYPAGWADLVKAAPVVVAVGAPAWETARAHASGTLVASMIPGLDVAELPKRATGVRLEVDPAELLNQLKPLMPSGKVNLFVSSNLSDFRARARAAAGSLGLTLVEHVVADAMRAQEGMRRLEPGAGAIWLSPESQLATSETFGVALEIGRKLRLPVIGFSHGMSRAGALASLSPDVSKAGTVAGQLARGLSERPTKDQNGPAPTIRFAPGDLTLNARTARELGIRIPDRLHHLATYLFR